MARIYGNAAVRSANQLHRRINSGMGSEGMVQELERLRKLLDVNPADQLRKDGSGIMTGSDSPYTGALNAAEV